MVIDVLIPREKYNNIIFTYVASTKALQDSKVYTSYSVLCKLSVHTLHLVYSVTIMI